MSTREYEEREEYRVLWFPDDVPIRTRTAMTPTHARAIASQMEKHNPMIEQRTVGAWRDLDE